MDAISNTGPMCIYMLHFPQLAGTIAYLHTGINIVHNKWKRYIIMNKHLTVSQAIQMYPTACIILDTFSSHRNAYRCSS